MSEPGPDEFRAVDHARLQAREDLGRRRGLRRGAEPAEHLAAEAEHAHLEAAQVGEALDVAAEPAAHAHAGIAAHERLRAERRIELVPQRLTAAGLDPRDMLVRREPERHRGVERRRRLLALPVERGGVAHVGDAGADRVEHLERRHHLARGMHGDLDAARRRACGCARRRAPPTCRDPAGAWARRSPCASAAFARAPPRAPRARRRARLLRRQQAFVV